MSAQIKKIENVGNFYKFHSNSNQGLTKYVQYYFEKCSTGEYKIHGLEVYDDKNQLSLYSKSQYSLDSCEKKNSKSIEFADNRNDLFVEMKNFKYREFKKEFLDFNIAGFKTVLVE